MLNTLLGRWAKDDYGFPLLTEPVGHQGWWFWGAMLTGLGMWCGIIAGACHLA